MKRLVLSTGEEYIIHDQTETKYDPLGNVKRFYKGGMGTYPIPIPRWEIKVNPDEGYVKEKYVAGIDNIERAYSIPFTPKNIEKLQKYCSSDSTTYIIQKTDYKAYL